MTTVSRIAYPSVPPTPFNDGHQCTPRLPSSLQSKISSSTCSARLREARELEYEGLGESYAKPCALTASRTTTHLPACVTLRRKESR